MNTYLSYVQNNETMKIDLCHPPTNDIELKTVISHFKVVISGDLSFYSTATGRDGHSHVRCTYCDLTSAQWNDSSNFNTTGTPMTLELLHHPANLHHSNPKADSKGVVMSPQLQVEPAMYIVPLLHLLIGLVNKLWSSMCHFLDEFVETIGQKEAGLKEKCEEYGLLIECINEEIEIHTVNKNIASAEIKSNPEAKEIYLVSCEMIRKLEDEKKSNMKLLKMYTSMKLDEKKKHLGDEKGMDYKLYAILKGSKIKKQSFHGGRRMVSHAVACSIALMSFFLKFAAWLMNV